jgi:hypothetical protein
MRRYLGVARLPVLLALAAGIAWYAWSAAEIVGASCGEPFLGYNSQTDIVFIVLLAVPAIVTGLRALVRQRSGLVAVASAVIASLLAFVAIYGAEFIFALNRHCFS